MNTLLSLKKGEKAKIFELKNSGDIKRRLQDIGLIKGTEVKCSFISPLGDPTAYLIKGALIAIRSEDAEKIITQREESV